LNKDGFNQLCGSYYDNIDKENLSFLRGFSFLKMIGNTKLLSMMYDIEQKKVKGKTVIYSEGQEANDIYFIRSGEIEIS
jgi:CRP-like cAMP-binding protein